MRGLAAATGALGLSVLGAISPAWAEDPARLELVAADRARVIQASVEDGFVVGEGVRTIDVVLPPEFTDDVGLPEEFTYEVATVEKGILASGTVPFDRSLTRVAVPVAGVGEQVGPDGVFFITLTSGHPDLFDLQPGDHLSASIRAVVLPGDPTRTSMVSLSSASAFNRIAYLSPAEPVTVSWGQTIEVVLPDDASWTSGIDREWSGLKPETSLTWTRPEGASDTGEHPLDESAMLSLDGRTLSVVLPEEEPETWVADGSPDLGLWIFSTQDPGRLPGVFYTAPLALATAPPTDPPSGASATPTQSSSSPKETFSEPARPGWVVPAQIAVVVAFLAAITTLVLRQRRNSS